MVNRAISIEKPGKQSQAKPVESDELAQALMRSAGTGIYIVQEGRFQYANPLFQELTGCTAEELLGTYSLNLVHPEDREVVRKKAVENLKGQSSYPYEYRFIKKNREVGWVLERVTSAEYTGKPATIGSFMDITERKRVEKSLQESEERFRTLFDSSRDAIMILSLPSWKFTSGNPATVEMFKAEDEKAFTSFGPWDLSPEKQPDGHSSSEKAKERIETAMREGSQFFEWTHKRLDGEEFPATVLLTRMEIGGQQLLQATVRDITERKRAEREREILLKDLKEINLKLGQSNKELQDFAYIASHDLREPLRKVASFGTLLQDSLEGKLDEDQQENFQFMIDGAKRMQAMIDDLLTYARITTRAKPFRQVNLNEVIEDLKNLELATLLDETEGTIYAPEPLPPVYGDSSQIRQLLQNLVGNGLKFHRTGIAPEITIRACQTGDNMARIEVQDNGIGINKKYHEQIFTMFKRLYSRVQYEGTDIGLAVCKKIVNRHRGDIGVKSTPGEGSTFWFTLPRASYSGDN